MASDEFDPKKFIDRDFETGIFTDLLMLQDDARILSIQDKGGMGKSQLLEKLRHLCKTRRPRVPVSLIALDELADDAPLTLVKLIVDHLTDAERTFPTFWSMYNAMLASDFERIRGPVAGSVNLTQANLTEAREFNVAGVQNIIEKATVLQTGPAAPLDPEQTKSAQKKTIEAFLTDLKQYADAEEITLILDAYDRCKDPIKDWLRDTLLEQYFFNYKARPKSLILVVAGRSVPEFDLNWNEIDIQKVVKDIQELSIWKKEHVIQCLKAYGFGDYTEEDLDFFYAMVTRKLPPSFIVQAIDTMKAARK